MNDFLRDEVMKLMPKLIARGDYKTIGVLQRLMEALEEKHESRS